MAKTTAESRRLQLHCERSANWKKWGPYLSERAWGTVREDYSTDGGAWEYFRCFALALWNGEDPILKERLFGLGNSEGNHGEDVKEYYFYLDNTPTHSYMQMLYKYPQSRFPYDRLVAENHRRSTADPEYELLDTGVFAQQRYFDVMVEYAKADTDDLLILIGVTNRGPDPAVCHVLPTLWFRNTWSWGYPDGPMGDVTGKPELEVLEGTLGVAAISARHSAAGSLYLYAEEAPELLFTENETNQQRLYGRSNSTPYVKDAFHSYLIEGRSDAVNPRRHGTKAAAHYQAVINPGDTRRIRLRLTDTRQDKPFETFEGTLALRRTEADEFYDALQRPDLDPEQRLVQRRALAGLLWTKQFFYFNVEQWIRGDPAMPPVPPGRHDGRNHGWEHLNNFDILSMPDKWEYPWYAGWDLAFHCIPLALVDAAFAKRQLTLMGREWYMHPNGQLPAYEWAFSDVNPPVHAWAAYRVYKIDAKQNGRADRSFLESIYHKLMLNFTWWVNKEDQEGKNVFQGGFLGLDNISVFDRSKPLPTGGYLDQSDATAWMGFYCLVMLKIALELARENPVYQDSASKFFEHFLRIAQAMTRSGHHGVSLWDEADEFFYDTLHLPDGQIIPLKVRSLVGLMPLLAVETLDAEVLEAHPDFHRRMLWFFQNRTYLRDEGSMACVQHAGVRERRLLSVVNRERLVKVLGPMLDENEFLSPYGIRSLSKYHREHPYHYDVNGQAHPIGYQPAESKSGLFGGNSNWRGPVWFPINYLLIESLQKFDHYYGDSLKVDFPSGSGNLLTLAQVARELSRRLIRLFLRDPAGRRPVYGREDPFQDDTHWQGLLLFHEYFHGENGAGLGASHQTGWTGLVAKLIQQSGGD